MLAGLNVFLLDTDVVFFHDPYKYLKSRFANYSLFSLSDSSVDVAKGNGGVWYLQNVLSRGPIAQRLLAAFEERTLCLVNRSDLPTIRYTDFRTGAPADRLLDELEDQLDRVEAQRSKHIPALKRAAAMPPQERAVATAYI